MTYQPKQNDTKKWGVSLMRVALINPTMHTKYPQPPLGLLSIATVCLHQGHSVTIIDANARRISTEQIVEQVDTFDAVGITAVSLSYPEALTIAKAIKKAHPYKFIVLGGVHATVATIDSLAFDAIVIGEGEEAILKVLKEMKPGVYWNGDRIVDLDAIPPLSYAILYGFQPRMSYGKHQTFMPLLISRGCPFHCSFCSKAVFGNKYRTMSIDNVMREIKRLRHQFGFKEVKFYDDVFTLDKDRVVELSNRIGDKVSWTCMTRVNLVDRLTLKMMKDGGCYCVAYGIESADPSILKSITKNIKLEQVEQAVRYSQEAGLKVIGYFMLGAPGETMETIKKTVDYAASLGIDYAQFSIATALPGSELYELVPERLRANFYLLPGEDNPSLCELSSRQLKQALKWANQRFKKEGGY